MPVMTVEPAELGPILAAHHLPALGEFEQRILTARCWGCGNSDLATIVDYAPDALRRLFERLEDVILGPTGMKRDLALVTQWFNQHLNCERQCLAHAKMLIEKRIVYGTE